MQEHEIRQFFPGVQSVRYFNAAAQSLLSTPAIDAMQSMAKIQSERGIIGWGIYLDIVAETRRLVAARIGADPREVAFVPTTGEGISRIASGFPWASGDEVLLCDLEFPSNVYPWAAQRGRGVRLRWVESEQGRVDVERYVDALGPRTRVVAVSHVQFSTGCRLDLEPLGRICAEKGILLCVDAIQSVGATPVDVRKLRIGAMAVDGRKWLAGPAGCGFLYVDDAWAHRIQPQAVGYMSVRNGDEELQYRRLRDADGQLDLEPLLLPGAARFEVGFPNLTGIAGLGAALKLADRIGHENWYGRIADHVAHFARRLLDAGVSIYGTDSAAERAGILAFEDPGDPVETFNRLNEEGYSLSVRDGRLRVSPHVYNTSAEIDALMDRLLTIWGRIGPNATRSAGS